MALSPEPAMGECLEHRIIRNNLADITLLISSDPSTGPTWFAQKLEEKAFIANAVSAVVLGYSKYEQTSKLVDAVKGKINTSQEPGKEFAKFLEILQSIPQLVDHAKRLLKEYNGKEEHATPLVAIQHIPTSTTSIPTHPPSQLVSDLSHTPHPSPELPYDPSHTPRPPPQLPSDLSHTLRPPPQLPYDPSHEQHPPPQLLSSLSYPQYTSSHPSPQAGLYHTPIPHLPTPSTIHHTPTQSPTPPYPILPSYTQPQVSSFPAPQQPLLTSNPTQPYPSYAPTAYGHTPIQHYGSTPQYTRMPLYSTRVYRPITSPYHPHLYMTYDLAHVHQYPPPTQPPDLYHLHTHTPSLQVHNTHTSPYNALTYSKPIPMANDPPYQPNTPRVPPLPPYVPAPTLHAIDEYAQYLRSYYQSKNLPTCSKWPPTASTQYIHLAVVRKKKVSKEKADKFTKLTLHGNIDDIVRVKEPLDFSGVGVQEDGSLSQFILVEGAPGIGKTTFAWEVSRRWSRGEILNQYRLVVLLKLRDKRVREARNIYDLFYHRDDELRREVAKEIRRMNGESVLLLYEGFDELPGKLQTQESVFLEILYREYLPEVTVLITSRPYATEFLQEKFKEQISQHIEILGFTKADVQSFIQSAVKDQKLRDEFSQYLTCYPHIRGLMYVPLNAVIVTEIYKTAKLDKSQEFVPTTLTELYTSLSRGMLLRYLKSHNKYGKEDWKLRSFSDLPEELHKQFNTICAIAFRGILKDEFIFDDLARDFNTLDLMQSAPELYVDQGAVVSHNFFHLTLQEFLAAVHVSQKSAEEHLQYFLQSTPSWIQQQRRQEQIERQRERQRRREPYFAERRHEEPEIDLLMERQQHSLNQDLDSTTESSTNTSDPLTSTLSEAPTILQKQGGIVPALQHRKGKSLKLVKTAHMQTTEPYTQQRLPSSKQPCIQRHQLQGPMGEPESTTEHSTSTSEPPTNLASCVLESELMETLALPRPEEVLPELQLAERKPLPQETPQAPQTTPFLTTQDQGRLEPLQVPMIRSSPSESTPPRPETTAIPDTADIGRLQLETQLELSEPQQQQLLSQREIPAITNPRPVIPHTLPVSPLAGSLPYDVLTSSHFQNVVKFTAGLTKLNGIPTNRMKSILLQDRGDYQVIPLYSLHWLFEAQCISTYSEMIAETATLTFYRPRDSSMTPFDFFVLGYALSHINSTWNIHIAESLIGDEGLEMMVAGMNYKETTLPPSLKSISLNLTLCDISSVGLSHLKEMPEQVATRITELELSANRDISEGVACLLSNLTSLKRLNLAGTSISTQEVGLLAELLSHSQLHKLEYLNLRYSLKSPESTSHILTALSNNTTLREIVLWGAHVSENNLSLLTSALITNTTLRKLDLSRCKINDNMVSEITSALCDNSTLQTLKLFGNAFGLSGATALAEMLRRNNTLEELYVWGNAIGEEGTLKLATSLEHNKTLKELVIDRKYEHSLPPELPLKTKNRIIFI